MKAIKITLKSDICAGSGFSYAGVIDSDICCDEYGIPYIPARRLKGCLREGAELLAASGLIEKEDIDAVFGVTGDDSVKGIMLDNAYIYCRKELEQTLSYTAGRFSKDDVLNSFASVKAQTMIEENGIAKDNSLRYIRTVNRYSPLDGRELEFIANCENIPEGLSGKLAMICKATRHMGLNRTRGLGNVRCELADSASSSESRLKVELPDSGRAVIEYTLTNTQPLLISEKDETASLAYIKGQMIQGALAAYYLKSHPADEHFENLFVSGKVKFANAYLSEGGSKYLPTPLCIGRYKGTDEYTGRFNPDQSKGIPKPVRDGYMCLNRTASGMKCTVDAPEFETVYHNRRERNGDRYRDDIGRLLYTSEVMKKGQSFTGTIEGEASLLREVAELLTEAPLRFGKSKTAQYGKCKLVSISDITAETTVNVKKGDNIIAVLASDAVFNDPYRGYSADIDIVRSQIKADIEKTCGLKLEDDSADSTEMDTFAIVTEYTGFYGVWNMRKMPKTAIAARSSFCFKATSDGQIPDMSRFMWTGCMNAEGAGQFYLLGKNDIERIDFMPAGSSSVNCGRMASDSFIPYLAGLEEVALTAGIHAKALDMAKKYGKWNNSFAGRIRLMMIESEQEHEAGMKKTQSFEERIESIRDKDKKPQSKELWNTVLADVEKAVENTEFISKLSDDDKNCVKRRLRFNYLTSVITEIKYLNSKKGDKAND